MPDAIKPPVTLASLTEQEGVAVTASPTGTPVIPPKAVPYVLLGVGLLEVVSSELENPAPWDASRAVRVGMRILAYLAAAASPGLRRQS